MIGAAQPIAVRKEEHLIGYLGGFGFSVHRHATLLLQVAVGPNIVIACKEVHLNPHICQFRYLAQETRVPFRHHIAIFVPEVEHIAQQIHGRSLVLYAIEKAHQASFLCAGMRYGPRSKMSIAKKIYILHRLLMNNYVVSPIIIKEYSALRKGRWRLNPAPVLRAPLRSSYSYPIRVQTPGLRYTSSHHQACQPSVARLPR